MCVSSVTRSGYDDQSENLFLLQQKDRTFGTCDRSGKNKGGYQDQKSSRSASISDDCFRVALILATVQHIPMFHSKLCQNGFSTCQETKEGSPWNLSFTMQHVTPFMFLRQSTSPLSPHSRSRLRTAMSYWAVNLWYRRMGHRSQMLIPTETRRQGLEVCWLFFPLAVRCGVNLWYHSQGVSGSSMDSLPILLKDTRR